MKKGFRVLVPVLIIAGLFLVLLLVNQNNSNNNNEATNKEEKISAGVWEGNVYTNSFLDIKFTNPEGWTYKSKEELADLMKLSLETLDNLTDENTEYIKELSKQITVYYLFSSNPKNGNCVQIITENPVMEVTEEYYLNKQFTNTEAIKYEVLDNSEKNIGKYDYKALTLKAKDYNIYQRVYIRKKDSYIINLAFTSTKSLDDLDEMAKFFE